MFLLRRQWHHVHVIPDYAAYCFRLLHDVSVEDIHHVGAGIDERWCLVCFVIRHAITAKPRHLVFVYESHTARVLLLLLDVDVVGIHGGEERFKIAYEIERYHMLLMNGFKFQIWVVHGIYYLLGWMG